MDIINANIRAELARHQVGSAEAGQHLGLKPRTVRDRLAGRTPWRFTEVAALSDWLGFSLDAIAAEEVPAHA